MANSLSFLAGPDTSWFVQERRKKNPLGKEKLSTEKNSWLAKYVFVKNCEKLCQISENSVIYYRLYNITDEQTEQKRSIVYFSSSTSVFASCPVGSLACVSSPYGQSCHFSLFTLWAKPESGQCCRQEDLPSRINPPLSWGAEFVCLCTLRVAPCQARCAAGRPVGSGWKTLANTHTHTRGWLCGAIC